VSRAVCEKCGAEIYWKATRGTRLADLEHAGCGGALRGKTAGQPSRTRGQKYGRCGVCEGRRLESRLRPVPFPFRAVRTGLEKVHPAGTPSCTNHEILPQARPYRVSDARAVWHFVAEAGDPVEDPSLPRGGESVPVERALFLDHALERREKGGA
jgi:hypothetical protein